MRERQFVRIVRDLDQAVPDDTWTILALHSLDGEGYEPWTSKGFARLVEAVSSMRYVIVSVAEVLNDLASVFP